MLLRSKVATAVADHRIGSLPVSLHTNSPRSVAEPFAVHITTSVADELGDPERVCSRSLKNCLGSCSISIPTLGVEVVYIEPSVNEHFGHLDVVVHSRPNKVVSFKNAAIFLVHIGAHGD